MFRFFILAALCAAQIYADPPTALQLNRSSAVQRALHCNLDLKAARWSIEQAQGRTADVGALANPSLNVTGASDFAFSNEGEYGWSIGLEQKFPITDRLTRFANIASMEVQLAELEVLNAERRLAFEVERVIDAIQAIQADLALYREQVALNQRFADFLLKKIKRAESSPLDAGQARIAIAALDQKILKLERERRAQLVRLRELLGLSGELVIDIVTPPADLDNASPLPEYQRADLEQHPDYQLRQQLAAIATERTALARAARWADITVELFFEQGLANNAIEDPFTGNIRVGPEEENLLGVGLSIPLPLHNQNRGEVISRQARERQMNAELHALGFRLLNEAAGIRAEYQTAQAQLSAFEQEVLNQAQENLKQLENAYSLGQVDLIQVFRAQEGLLELKVDFAELHAESQRLITRWRYVTGANLPERSTPEANEN